MSDYFCAFPFKHIAIRPSGKVVPCCNYDWAYLKDMSIDSYNESSLIKEMRYQAESNIPHEGCSACYNREKVNGSSMRTMWNQELGTDTEVKLEYLELALSNSCNNKCIMCNSDLSTSWYQDNIKLNSYFKENNISPVAGELSGQVSSTTMPRGIMSKIPDINYRNLKFLKIIGGEPLMEEEKFIDILSRCNLSELTVMLVTNCTKIPSNKLYNLLKQCKTVECSLSIDSTGRLNEFLRKGSKWEQVIETSDWFIKNIPRTDIMSVVSIYNVNNFFDLPLYMRNRHNRVINQVWLMVSGKPWMRPRNLPEQSKNKLIQLITTRNELANPIIMSKVIAELNCQGDFDLFLRNDQALREVRHDDWREINTELWNIVDVEHKPR